MRFLPSLVALVLILTGGLLRAQNPDPIVATATIPDKSIVATVGTPDFRHYFFARPFTFAIRTMGAARLGRDAETNRITPLYVGDGSMVRGYSVFSFDPSECTNGVEGGSDCPEFDRLVGSRIGVANLEFRIPLFGTPQLGLLSTRFLPIEISPFVDAGVAWTGSSAPVWSFDRNSADRTPVMSAGITSRLNMFGFAIFEVYYARPFQRPARGGMWGFLLSPGW